MKRHALIAAVVLACASGGQQTFTPPKHYPEWSLKDQDAAMKGVEHERRKNRVDGLREKTPPADWIAFAYHGLVLDANFDEIVLDPATVRAMQESLFTVLQVQKQRDLKPLFFTKDLDEKNLLIVRGAILDEFLTLADPKLRDRYVWRHDLMRRAAGVDTAIHPHVLALLRQYDLRITTPITAMRGAEYIAACEAEEVPIPPDWPDPRWVHQGRLGFTFISLGRTADVYTYKDLDVPGICYALPRANAKGQIELLSITCQSKRTGKACFWDNRTLRDKLISPVDRLEIRNIGNGYTLGENCTECHRGYNAYNIHPGTALDVTRPKVIRAPYDPDRLWHSDPDVRYSPIGRSAFQNPPPLDETALPLPAPLPNGFRPACNGCHEIPQTRGALYCGSVLTQAMNATMPPRPPRPPAYQWTREDFMEHINRLRACP